MNKPLNKMAVQATINGERKGFSVLARAGAGRSAPR